MEQLKDFVVPGVQPTKVTTCVFVRAKQPVHLGSDAHTPCGRECCTSNCTVHLTVPHLFLVLWRKRTFQPRTCLLVRDLFVMNEGAHVGRVETTQGCVECGRFSLRVSGADRR